MLHGLFMSRVAKRLLCSAKFAVIEKTLCKVIVWEIFAFPQI